MQPRTALILMATALALTSTSAIAADAAAGAAKYKQFCTTCHGETGKGDGPAAAGLPVKPRNLADAEWQKTVDDAYLIKVIKEGGTAVGKSPMMTPFGAMLDAQATDDIVAHLRSLD